MSGMSSDFAPALSRDAALRRLVQSFEAAGLPEARTDARFLAPGRREDRWQFDLAGYCAHRLAAAGIAVAEAAGVDTLAEEARFFSHRRRTLAGGGPIGHQLSAIALAP